ncbi:PadR family transcriptional regulator [Deinococcus radiophilus]|uniref:PadR family transcriptional regulator n=1 Tax=Deinococcus radiophilus TaxID=32062 RepID=A0A3S0RD00_9DEIO|nr:helix-turn-helix transcriptional regulator [Deinococcus radiophilus]RTR25343.1 PadR family transcriptional regulator [Deinococcus radiophilus]UFA50489.1 helix-turn-helix transcriptional regulator [Deinococcus radiophilus]
MPDFPSPDLLRGHLDLILLSILEDQPLYGFAIIQAARSRSDGYFDFREGSLYPALHRLEKAGWLRSQSGEVGRNGKPRRYYALTAEGQRHLTHKRQEFEQFTGAVRRLGGSVA